MRALAQAQLEFSPAQRARLEKQWFLCSKRLAQAEVTRQRWDDVLRRQQGAQEVGGPREPLAATAHFSASCCTQGERQRRRRLALVGSGLAKLTAGADSRLCGPHAGPVAALR